MARSKMSSKSSENAWVSSMPSPLLPSSSPSLPHPRTQILAPQRHMHYPPHLSLSLSLFFVRNICTARHSTRSQRPAFGCWHPGKHTLPSGVGGMVPPIAHPSPLTPCAHSCALGPAARGPEQNKHQGSSFWGPDRRCWSLADFVSLAALWKGPRPPRLPDSLTPEWAAASLYQPRPHQPCASPSVTFAAVASLFTQTLTLAPSFRPLSPMPPRVGRRKYGPGLILLRDDAQASNTFYPPFLLHPINSVSHFTHPQASRR